MRQGVKKMRSDADIRLLSVDDGPWVGCGEGLYLRIHRTKGGVVTKTWCLRQRKSMRGLGLRWPDTPLKEARNEARRIALGMKDAHSTKTFREAVEDYRKTVLKAQQRGSHREAILENHMVP